MPGRVEAELVPSPRRAVGSLAAVIPVRDDLRALEGYHSPQIDVKVRLNTNESPLPPPAAWRDALAAEMSRVEWHRYPDRQATELREAIAALHGVAPEMVFAANGSNEVLQTILLTYAGPGRTVATFEPTYQMHAQIARVVGSRVVEGERNADFTLGVDEMRRVVDSAAPHVVFLTLAQQPDRVGRAGGTGRAVAGDRARARRRRRGVRAVRRLVGARSGRRVASARRDAHVLEDVEHGRGPARLRDRSGVVRARPRRGRAAVSPRRRQADRRPAGAALRRRDGCPRAADRRRARADQRRDAGDADRRHAERRQLRAVPADAAFPGREVWQALVDRSVLVRDCSGWPRLANCLRVTVGTPEENDVFLAALDEIVGSA